MPTPYLVGTLDGFIGQASQLDGGSSGGPNFQNPPFEYGGKTYVAYSNWQVDPGTSFLAVSSSPDRQTFTVLDPDNAPASGDTGSPVASSYSVVDIPNARIVFVSFAATTHKLYVIVFDLVAEAWQSPIAIDGPVLGFTNNTNPMLTMTMISATKFLIHYAVGAYSGLSYVVLDAGTWGTPTIVVGDSGHPVPSATLLGAAIDAGGFTHCWYERYIYGHSFSFYFITNAILCYDRVDSSGISLGEVQITNMTVGNVLGFVGSVPKYIDGVNRIAFPIFIRYPASCSPVPPNSLAIAWVDDPSGTPAISLEGIASPAEFYVGPPYLFTSIDESVYYVAVQNITFAPESPLGIGWELIIFFQRGFDISSWTGPTTFYDAQANPPSGPPYPLPPDPPIEPTPPAELNSVAFAIYADGTIAGTFGMLASICGVEFFVSVGSPTTQTLELTKIVVGGPSVPGDFTLSATGATDSLSGQGHVGPSAVAADTYELDEVILSGATWDSDSGTWSSDDSTWDGDYIPGAWNCGSAEMPTPTSVIVPPGGAVACTITNTFEGPAPPPPPPAPGSDAVGCFELLRVDVTLMPARHLPVRGSTK